ncbi:MAG: type II and III secretion system protein family protein [Kiloniellales bacterium]
MFSRLATLRPFHLLPGLGAKLPAAVMAALFLSLSGLALDAKAADDDTKVTTVTVELSEGRLVRLDDPASSVFIANPAIADVNVKSSRLIYLFGTRPGETSLFALDEEDNVIANIKVVVTHNLSRLNASLSQLAPDSDIRATSINGAIVLSGAVRNATQAEDARRLATRFIGENEEVINQLDVTAPNQINLRVRIAEVSRTVINQFGINWESAYTGASNFLFGIATGSPVVPGTLFGTQTVSPPAASGSFLTRNNLGNSIFFNSTAGNFDVNGLIDLLASDGLVTVLAEPNLTALSGETASFLAGGEFPIPVPQNDGNITISFKQFGVQLAFTPTLVGDKRISMRVAPEVSQLSNSGAIVINSIQIPALTTRRAETTVELGSGQAFAIAGLMLDSTQQNTDKVPGLSDLPILGALFRSDSFQRAESELVIIVTPYIVQPVASDRLLSAPTDPYVSREPNAAERELAISPSQPQTIPLASGLVPANPPSQPSGFIVE